MGRKKPNMDDYVSTVTEGINDIMSQIRTRTTPKNLKELAYFIMQFSGICWEYYSIKEWSDVKYKIERNRLIDSLVQKWLSYNKAEKEVEVLVQQLYIESKKAESDYKKAILLKEAYVNFMRAAKLDMNEWVTSEMVSNAFSNISD